ncbi:hypothetical protein FAZ95_31360 [Trinickia violacea]|uniref:Type VI secretion system component TssM1 N-terminal domain-containing protein n=1 Tax=Trinickia violacea TaxID=2571746 RepID=A0A4P8IYB1_9BURK|nr:type VI secretion system protein [Trinickia violacea]QCP53541.1 hypothetical protein FAZ95_31360 [Trinickia violacea]
MTLVVILLGLIALILLALVAFAVWQWWRRREDGRPLRSFRAAVRAAHAAMGVPDAYSIPRILATGSPAAIDALCRSWRMTPAGDPGWYGRVWHDAEGLLIAEPNDMLAAPPADRQLGVWRRLLRAVLRNRPGRPLDAILWVIAADALVTEDGQPRETSAVALESSRKLFALQRQFGQMLPLYVVISGCDAIPGFDALATGLQGAAGGAPLGWASPYPPKRAYEDEWIGEAFATMRNALTETIAELGTLNGGVGEGLFLLPQRIDALRTPLRERIDLALRGGADGTAPLLRGIHCVGSVPERLPPGDANGVLGLRASAPAFAARLWHDVVLRGQGLAWPIPRVLALRMRRHRVATIAAAALAVCWCVGLGVSWWHLRSDARTLAGAYDSLTLALTTYRESDRSDAAAAKVLGTAAGTLMNVPRWRLTSPFMPLSYMTLESELDDTQEQMLRSVVFAPLRDRLMQRFADLSCAAGAASGADATQETAAKPQDLPEYLGGTQLVAKAAQIEHLISRYNELVEIGTGDLAMLAQLLREAEGVTLAPERVPDRESLDAVVRDIVVDNGLVQFSSAPAVAARQRASLCFEQSFDAWFDRVYSDSTLTANAALVQTALTDLRAPGATPTDAALSTLASGIDTLAAQVDTADHGWASAHGKELVPGLTTTFDTAQHLQLIGAAPVAAVLAHEEAQQNAFSARWLVSGNLPGVLSATPASGLQLAADLPQLREALRTLLAQPFAGGSPNANAAIRSVDAASAQRALAVLPAYRQYVAGPLAQAPDAYRGPLLAAAGNDAVQSMVGALSAPASPATQRDVASAADAAMQFDALKKSALDLIAAFDSLGRDDLATTVALRVSDAALAVLRASDAQLESLAPFRPVRGDFSGWNGSPGGALRAFGAATPQALQTYLAAQAAAVAEAAGSAASALDWLNAQKPPLEPSDARLVARWRALSADLTQYRAKSPASAMIAVPAIISEQLDKLDLNNCSATLEQIDVPAAGDIVASAGVRLVSSAREQCFRLQMGTGMEAYEQIRNFFARYLAGRFPFAADANAPAADVRQTAAFVALLDAHLADAQRGLAAAAAVGRGRPDEARFIAQLAAAKPWLDALLARGADGSLQGMELSVEWRVDRVDEVGADQVIEWKLASGSDTLTYPSSGEPPVRWKPGLPVSISLRWAKDAPWQPMFDAAQPTLTGANGVATWSAADAWAFLRIARLHQMPADAGAAIAGQSPRLLFTVPVRDRNGAIQTARMYLRVGFINAAKAPQAIPDLPVAAPGYGVPGTTTLGYPPAAGFSEAGRG